MASLQSYVVPLMEHKNNNFLILYRTVLYYPRTYLRLVEKGNLAVHNILRHEFIKGLFLTISILSYFYYQIILKSQNIGKLLDVLKTIIRLKKIFRVNKLNKIKNNVSHTQFSSNFPIAVVFISDIVI